MILASGFLGFCRRGLLQSEAEFIRMTERTEDCNRIHGGRMENQKKAESIRESLGFGPMEVGLVGLGLVGSAIAIRLISKGYGVTGFDLDDDAKSKLERVGGTVAKSGREVARRCDRIFMSLPDGGIVESVVDEMMPDFVLNTILVDTTTAEPEQVLAVGKKLAGIGIGYLDATLSGSSEQVACGDATWLIGGERNDFDKAEELFHAIGGLVHHVGPVGAGTRMKLVSNLILGLNRAVLAEGLALAKSWDMDLVRTLEILKTTSAYSKVMDVKGQKMIERNYQPQARLKQHHKDVRILLKLANEKGLKLYLSELHGELMRKAEDEGLGDLDNSAIAEIWR